MKIGAESVTNTRKIRINKNANYSFAHLFSVYFFFANKLPANFVVVFDDLTEQNLVATHWLITRNLFEISIFSPLSICIETHFKANVKTELFY